MRNILNLRLFGLMAFFSICSFAQKNEKPNIIWIITDEHNFRTLGCYRDLMSPEQALQWGAKVVETPNIDWLAKNGALFTSMYASSPVCTPSRASMFTGQYPYTVNVPVNNNIMDVSYPTIATVLSENGYKTGYAGKWHLSGESKPGWAPNPNYGFQDNQYMFNRGHWKKFGMKADGTPFVDATDKKGELSYGMNNADEKSYSTDWIVDRAIDFVGKNKQAPFFYVISLPEPHGPDNVRPPYDTMYTDFKFDMPRTFMEARDAHAPKWRKEDKEVESPEKMQNMIATYFGSVKCIDDNIGKLIASLKEQGILENTIIAFSSDHGDLLGEHNQINKGAPFEGSALIPFVVYHGKSITPGTVVNKAVNTADWMPTFLSLAGVKNQPKSAGRDMTPLLGTPELKTWDDVTFSRIHKSWLAAFDNRYKLVIDVSNSKPWLIDTEKDPDEVINYYGEPSYKEATVQLAKKLLGYINEQKDPFKEDAKFMKKLNNVLAYK